MSELPIPPRRGRRDNGLDAAAFVPLADIDPRIGEHLLDVLKLAGVPAYLEPSSDVDAYTRAIALPSPPTDRLWVDRDQRASAREIVEAEVGPPPTRDPGDDRPSGGLTDTDEERAWLGIVANFGRRDEAPVPPWPVEEDATEAASVEPADESDEDPLGPAPPAPPEPDEEEHYVPPPPPPVPRLSRQGLLAIVSLLVGAVLLIAPAAVGVTQGTGLTLGVIGIVFGTGLLVWRLGDRSRNDDGPDDGAIV